MEKLTFKNIIDSLDDGYDPNERERIFDLLLKVDLEDAALLGARQFLIDNQFNHVALRNYLQENRTNIRKNRFSLNKNVWIRIAAVFIGVVVFSYLTIFRQSNFDMSPYEAVEQGLPVMMGEESNKHFSDGMSRFKQKEYKESIKLLVDCLPSDTVTYYIGICEYFEKEYNLSLVTLNKIPSSSNFYQKAQFFKALALVKQKKYKEAKQALYEINEPELVALSKELLSNLPND